jgi:hypothetical protein
MDAGADPDNGDKVVESQIHDYKIDTLGRRYPVGIYGDRVIPNNRRPQGVPKDIWRRLKEGDRQSLVEATREYEERKNAPSSSSALPAIPEGDDELQPLATMIGNVFVATIDDQCETFVSEWIKEFEGYSIPVSGAFPVSSGAFPVKHREKLESTFFPGACVCRPVDRKEVSANPAATKAIQQVWDRLRARNAWDESNPREWDDVAREARIKGTEVHFGMIFGFVVEKKHRSPRWRPKKKV